MSYPADVFFDIETLVNVAQPESILLLGDASFGFLDRYIEQKSLLNQGCVLRHISSSEIGNALQLEQRFDVAIAIDLFEHLTKQQGSQILARMRDVLCPQYCICLPIDSGDTEERWQLTELFGFALSKVADYQQGDIEYGLFNYNISNYKKTPEWLNSDNWANPQMWGKYWW